MDWRRGIMAHAVVVSTNHQENEKGERESGLDSNMGSQNGNFHFQRGWLCNCCCFSFSISRRCNGIVSSHRIIRISVGTHLRQQLYRKLDTVRLACNGDHSLALVAARRRRTASVCFHNFDVRLAAKPNFVYFIPTLPNDASDKTVRDKNLLRLLLLRRIEVGRGCIRVAVTRHIRRAAAGRRWGWWARTIRRPVRGVRG